MPEQTQFDSSMVDEPEAPSTASITNICFTDNDYDFESEEKPKELSIMRKARMSNRKSLKDGKKYNAILKKISGRTIEYKNMDILSILYDVDLEDGSLKEIEDAFFFPGDNLTSASNNQRRLENCMSRFGVTIKDNDYDNISSLKKSFSTPCWYKSIPGSRN